jgi:hypothetical protein
MDRRTSILQPLNCVISRSHLIDVEKHPGALEKDAAEQLLDVVRTYLK